MEHPQLRWATVPVPHLLIGKNFFLISNLNLHFHFEAMKLGAFLLLLVHLHLTGLFLLVRNSTAMVPSGQLQPSLCRQPPFLLQALVPVSSLPSNLSLLQPEGLLWLPGKKQHEFIR